MIPNQFQLMGHTISVKVVAPDKWEHGEDVAGIWIPMAHEIHINGDLDESLQQHTYLHECCHAILDSLNHKLARDEKFVDQLSGLLHQTLISATYTPKRHKKAKA